MIIIHPPTPPHRYISEYREVRRLVPEKGEEESLPVGGKDANMYVDIYLGVNP